MKHKKEKKKPNRSFRAAVFAAPALLCGGVALTLLFVFTKYDPLLLTALTLFIPSVCSLVLFYPRSAAPRFTARVIEEPEHITRRFKFKRLILKTGGFFKRALFGLLGLLAKGREIVITALCMLSVLLLNVFFWRHLLCNDSGGFGFAVPVVIAAVFVLVVAADTFCSHARKTDETGYWAVVVKNLSASLLYAKIILVLLLALTAVKALGLYDAAKFYLPFIIAVFVYETLFTLLATAVCLIKHDFAENPDIYIPVPWRRSAGPGIIAYLEQNTGISMRSLWSIRLVRSALPYALMGVALALWFSTGIVYIGSQSEGALYRLGRLRGEPLSPGLHVTLPWPVDKTDVYDVKSVRKMTVGYSTEDNKDNLWTQGHTDEYKLLLGGGNELVSLNLIIEYHINDLEKYLKCSTAPESLLESAAYERVTAHTIGTDLESMLETDRAEFAAHFESELKDRIKDYDTGLEVVSVIVENIHPPTEVADVYERMLAVNVEAAKQLLDAQGEAGKRLAEAQTEKDTSVNTATAEQYAAVSDARSAVAEFSASAGADREYGSNYRYYKYLEAIKKAYADANIVIVGQGVDSSNIYLGNYGDITSEKE